MKARLLGADLSGVNFLGVDLSGALMSGARLEGSVLSQARLSGAMLNDATLTNARHIGTDLRDPDWRGATVGIVAAHGADFTGARNPAQAQLEHAIGDAGTQLPWGTAPDTGTPSPRVLLARAARDARAYDRLRQPLHPHAGREARHGLDLRLIRSQHARTRRGRSRRT